MIHKKETDGYPELGSKESDLSFSGQIHIWNSELNHALIKSRISSDSQPGISNYVIKKEMVGNWNCSETGKLISNICRSVL